MTSRRAKQLATRVEQWQHLLKPLGLAQYTIDGVNAVDEPGGSAHQVALVTPSTNYDRCNFEFQNEMIDDAYEKEDFEYLDQTILHEWLHVAFQPFENSIALAEGHMGPATEELWHEALDHTREQLIDRLARQLYAAFKDDVVPYQQ